MFACSISPASTLESSPTAAVRNEPPSVLESKECSFKEGRFFWCDYRKPSPDIAAQLLSVTRTPPPTPFAFPAQLPAMAAKAGFKTKTYSPSILRRECNAAIGSGVPHQFSTSKRAASLGTSILQFSLYSVLHTFSVLTILVVLCAHHVDHPCSPKALMPVLTSFMVLKSHAFPRYSI